MTLSERTREIGLLRAAGTTARQVARHLRPPGPVRRPHRVRPRVLLGIAVAAAMIGFLRTTRAVLIDGLPLNPWSLLLAFAIGAAVTFAAAALPAPGRGPHRPPRRSPTFPSAQSLAVVPPPLVARHRAGHPGGRSDRLSVGARQRVAAGHPAGAGTAGGRGGAHGARHRADQPRHRPAARVVLRCAGGPRTRPAEPRPGAQRIDRRRAAHRPGGGRRAGNGGRERARHGARDGSTRSCPAATRCGRDRLAIADLQPELVPRSRCAVRDAPSPSSPAVEVRDSGDQPRCRGGHRSRRLPEAGSLIFSSAGS